MIFRAGSASCDHQSFHDQRSFKSNSSFNSNFPGEYHNNYSHGPNITLNGQRASHLEQMRHTVNDVTLLMTVVVDQAIIQTALSSVETFDGNKSKFEAWIISVENTAQISFQDIL